MAKKEVIGKDLLGQDIKEGDFVVMATGASARLQIAKIKKITPKGCTVYSGGSQRWGGETKPNTKSCGRDQIVKMNEADAIILNLQGKWSF